MTRRQWIILAILTAPVMFGAFIVSATLGPLGALAYAGLGLISVNVRHLFLHTDHDDR